MYHIMPILVCVLLSKNKFCISARSQVGMRPDLLCVQNQFPPVLDPTVLQQQTNGEVEESSEQPTEPPCQFPQVLDNPDNASSNKLSYPNTSNPGLVFVQFQHSVLFSDVLAKSFVKFQHLGLLQEVRSLQKTKQEVCVQKGK